MELQFKPDADRVLDRMTAWWEGRLTGEPLVHIAYPAPTRRIIPPESRHGTLRERWMDPVYQADLALAQCANTVWYADALPVMMPNLGPEIFSVGYGCPLEFQEETTWTRPILHPDREEVDPAKVRFDWDNPYIRSIIDMTDVYIERAAGRFLVAYTDFHPGGDAIAALREPQELCVDFYERPDFIRAMIPGITDDFLGVYDFFHERLRAAGMPSTGWIPLASPGRFHIPSNDFSCMIDTTMFEEFFLPGIVRECRHMDHCVYHLDGPGALRHLDALLAVPEIQAIQWVFGAGGGRWTDWIDVYQKIQKAGKNVLLYLNAREIDPLFEHVSPDGLYLQFEGVRDQWEADAILYRLKAWR